MFKLDDNLLRELGLGALPPQEKNRMLAHIYETLEMRVGMRLAEGMSSEQLDEFEKLMPTKEDTDEVKTQKEKDALGWLESNFPNYKQVVAEELDKLKQEIKASSQQILASVQQQSDQQQQQPQGFQQPPQQSPQQHSQPHTGSGQQQHPQQNPGTAPPQPNQQQPPQNPPQSPYNQ